MSSIYILTELTFEWNKVERINFSGIEVEIMDLCFEMIF